MVLTKLHHRATASEAEQPVLCICADKADDLVAAFRLLMKSGQLLRGFAFRKRGLPPFSFLQSFFIQHATCSSKGNNGMFFRNLCERRSNWDYRDYCDQRTRQKRRQRFQLSIVAGLMVCLLLMVGLGAARTGF
jgi:hypothetical protein